MLPAILNMKVAPPGAHLRTCTSTLYKLFTCQVWLVCDFSVEIFLIKDFPDSFIHSLTHIIAKQALLAQGNFIRSLWACLALLPFYGQAEVPH